jgi:hypothetical protein
MFPDFTDLAKASQKFVIRKHSGGFMQPQSWWLYSPNGSRYDVKTHKAAINIAKDGIKRLHQQATADRMHTLGSKLRGQSA